jgi:hypothetical protein
MIKFTVFYASCNPTRVVALFSMAPIYMFWQPLPPQNKSTMVSSIQEETQHYAESHQETPSKFVGKSSDN